MRVKPPRQFIFLRRVRSLYQETLFRPAAHTCLERHLSKRRKLAFSTRGLRETLQASEEYTQVIEPLVAEIRAIYARLVGDAPSATEIKDCIDRFRTRLPERSAQIESIRSGTSSRYLGIRPLKIELDLSSQCNLRCVMCYLTLDRFSKRERVDMRVADFKKIAEQILPFCSRASLSIGTEPMLSKDFEAILEVLGSYEVPWTYMSTNGLLLTESIADKMIDVEFKGFAVSVDASTEATYERVRKGGKFARLLKNIKMLQAAKARRGARFPVVNFNYVLMRSNIEEFPQFVELAHELGVEGIAAMHITPFEGLDLSSESLVHDQELCNTMLDKAEGLAHVLGMGIKLPPRFTGIASDDLAEVVPEGFQLNVDEERRVSRCTFPWHFVGIDPYGNVLPCGWWYTEVPMGNIKTQSFDEIWKSPAWTKLREEHESGNLRDTCKTCPAAGMGNVDNGAAFTEVRLGSC